MGYRPRLCSVAQTSTIWGSTAQCVARWGPIGGPGYKAQEWGFFADFQRGLPTEVTLVVRKRAQNGSCLHTHVTLSCTRFGWMVRRSGTELTMWRPAKLAPMGIYGQESKFGLLPCTSVQVAL